MKPLCPDIVINVCCNCLPTAALPRRQWIQNDLRVQIRELPCTGRIDIQYLMHAFEEGAKGICIVACPVGECTLAAGNYRADIRVTTVKNLLAEIGLNPERVSFVNFSKGDENNDLEKILKNKVEQFATLEPEKQLYKGKEL